MGKLFGTDGIRGIANRDPMTCEMGLKVGRAVAAYCRERETPPKIVVGRDTRASGIMLEYALISGILSAGADAVSAEVLPTPGVAFLTRELKAGAGVVISASHNPFEYNGFKVFSHEGFKLSEEDETHLESLIEIKKDPTAAPEAGRVSRAGDADERYLSFLMGSLPPGYDLEGMKIVLDCANGATYRVAPELFRRLGARVEPLFIAPDGRNINLDCGSQYSSALSERVVATGSDVGLAFDGDGDRLIAVDERGDSLTGDQIMVICAKYLKENNELKNDLVVSTVMSNLGFIVALKEMGINHIATKVGDRYVMEEMRAGGAVLGGEESGHILFLKHHTTGDGILAALNLLWAIKSSGRSLHGLSTLMRLFPQVMINVNVARKPEISRVPELSMCIKEVEEGLKERGRVLVRYSGTEPICRIMVEGERQDQIDAYARRIADIVKERLNS